MATTDELNQEADTANEAGEQARQDAEDRANQL